jgi:hypothetical protein
MPEITMESSKRSGEVLYAIKLHFHAQYGELGDIILDSLTVGATPQYRPDRETNATKFTPEKLKANLEAGGILKEQFAASWRECDKANKEYMKDRRAAFYALRTLTSKEVDDELATRKTFRDLVADDPIGLLAEMKAVVTLKYGGITLKDQELASTEFHNMEMKRGESITAYATRAEGLVEAMAHSGIKKTHLPTPAAQAMNFIDGLDGEVESYLQLMAHCENSLAVFGADVYPTTLPDALRFASKFKPLTTTKALKAERPETVIAPTPPIATVLTARHETAGNKKTGKAGSGTAPYTSRIPADEEVDWKKKIICRTCGVKGHIEKECPEKKAFQECLATRKVLSAHTNTVYTSFGDEQPDDGDDYVPYPYYIYKG